MFPLPCRSKATTPRSKEKAPVPKARLLRSRARSTASRVGPRSNLPASYRKMLQDWWLRTRMLWQQVVLNVASGASESSGNCSLHLA
ncbi:hypothetical protein ACRRTK_015814 [Alexandromys fortis]